MMMALLFHLFARKNPQCCSRSRSYSEHNYFVIDVHFDTHTHTHKHTHTTNKKKNKTEQNKKKQNKKKQKTKKKNSDVIIRLRIYLSIKRNRLWIILLQRYYDIIATTVV